MLKDFAILARTRSEMEPIEECMRKVGVPFTRYKDDHLFDGRECASWIALFKALNAPDFTSRNRRILNELLMTDFLLFLWSRFKVIPSMIRFVKSEN